jgi:glutamate/tyrosine decarboxylase-like PLP-dependent enzyme
MVFSQLKDVFETLQSDIPNWPITPCVRVEEIQSYLRSRYDFTQALPLDQVVSDVEKMLRSWQVQITHPRYFGLFNPSVTFASVLADTLAAMYNPQLAAWRTSPAANEIERHTLSWLSAKFGMPLHASATFTSGGAEANLSAVVVALTRAFPEYGEEGLHRLGGCPTIYLTRESHHSFNKIAHITGLGRRALRTVATDYNLKMDPADLSTQVTQDRQNGFLPFMVTGTAGTTAAGAIDPLRDLSTICRRENLWFHVDAAWGGAAVISPLLKIHLAGIETADSITCDAHKWFSVPMGAGMFFCRHADVVAEAFRADAPYMPRKMAGPVNDPYTSSVQWSRRFIGLKLFLALARYGESGYAGMIEHQTKMGDVLRESLQKAGWRIVNRTPLPLVCFTREGLDTSAFLAELQSRQIAWMSEVRIGGDTPALRACITSFRTTEADIDWVVSEMSRLAA